MEKKDTKQKSVKKQNTILVDSIQNDHDHTFIQTVALLPNRTRLIWICWFFLLLVDAIQITLVKYGSHILDFKNAWIFNFLTFFLPRFLLIWAKEGSQEVFFCFYFFFFFGFTKFLAQLFSLLIFVILPTYLVVGTKMEAE